MVDGSSKRMYFVRFLLFLGVGEALGVLKIWDLGRNVRLEGEKVIVAEMYGRISPDS